MSEVEKIAAQISGALPDVKRGTLRFWGTWFGRPHDNMHRLVKVASKKDTLKLYFDEGEVLIVLSPNGLTLEKLTFRIDRAERIRWEWFDYGRPKLDRNLCRWDFVWSDGRVLFSHDDGWYGPLETIDLSLPAVEIL
jgi:hypothetical protein